MALLARVLPHFGFGNSELHSPEMLMGFWAKLLISFMSYRWLTKRGGLTFSRSGWRLGGSPLVSWPPAPTFKRVTSWERTELGHGSRDWSWLQEKATDNFKWDVSCQPSDLGSRQREAQTGEKATGWSRFKEIAIGKMKGWRDWSWDYLNLQLWRPSDSHVFSVGTLSGDSKVHHGFPTGPLLFS